MRTLEKWVVLGLLLGAVVFGVTQFYLRQAYEQHLEADYNRAFQELSVHVNGLEVELAKVQVSSSSERQVDSLANIMRLVYAAQANLGQLPIGGLNLSKIEALLANIQDHTVAFTKKALRGEIVQDYSGLTELYAMIKYVNQQLQTDLNQDQNRTSWVSWRHYFQTAVAKTDDVQSQDYPLVQSLVMIEDGMQRFSTERFPGELARLGVEPLSGERLSKEAAVVTAQEFLQALATDRQLTVTNEGSGQNPTYTVTASATNMDPIMVEVAQNGGAVLWLTNPREVAQSNLSPEQLVTKATEFLAQRGITNVKQVGIDNLQNRTIISFVPQQDNVLIYPQQLKVQVAQDTGEIVGYQGLAYNTYQNGRILNPKLDVTQAQSRLQPDRTVLDQRLTVILDSSFSEVLCWEFRIEQGDNQFLVYINAENGYEEKIIRVERGESIST